MKHRNHLRAVRRNPLWTAPAAGLTSERTARAAARRGAVVTATLVSALVTTLIAAPAEADGYNEWTAGVADPGMLYMVPALSLQASPVFQAYPQMQVQAGLYERVDVILTAASWITKKSATADALYIQPRVQIVEGLALSPGLSVPITGAGAPWTLSPGIFHTMEPEGWQISWNLVGYLNPKAWSDSSFFFVTVVEKIYNDTWSFYVELDVSHTLSSPASQAELVGVVGTQVAVTDSDTVNVCVFTPLRPGLELAQTSVGMWWSHGFTMWSKK